MDKMRKIIYFLLLLGFMFFLVEANAEGRAIDLCDKSFKEDQCAKLIWCKFRDGVCERDSGQNTKMESVTIMTAEIPDPKKVDEPIESTGKASKKLNAKRSEYDEEQEELTKVFGKGLDGVAPGNLPFFLYFIGYKGHPTWAGTIENVKSVWMQLLVISNQLWAGVILCLQALCAYWICRKALYWVVDNLEAARKPIAQPQPIGQAQNQPLVNPQPLNVPQAVIQPVQVVPQ